MRLCQTLWRKCCFAVRLLRVSAAPRTFLQAADRWAATAAYVAYATARHTSGQCMALTKRPWPAGVVCPHLCGCSSRRLRVAPVAPGGLLGRRSTSHSPGPQWPAGGTQGCLACASQSSGRRSASGAACKRARSSSAAAPPVGDDQLDHGAMLAALVAEVSLHKSGTKTSCVDVMLAMAGYVLACDEHRVCSCGRRSRAPTGGAEAGRTQSGLTLHMVTKLATGLVELKRIVSELRMARNFAVTPCAACALTRAF